MSSNRPYDVPQGNNLRDARAISWVAGVKGPARKSDGPRDSPHPEREPLSDRTDVERREDS